MYLIVRLLRCNWYLFVINLKVEVVYGLSLGRFYIHNILDVTCSGVPTAHLSSPEQSCLYLIGL